MARKKKHAPGPWRVQYNQYFASGAKSRPAIFDAEGEPVSFRSGPNAELASLSPQMLALLERVEFDARMWWLRLKSEFPNEPEPQWWTDLLRLITQARTKGLL